MSQSITRSPLKKKQVFAQRQATKRSREQIRRRFLTLENLEGRSLLAALVADVMTGTASTTISGTVYEDLNSNGIKDGGENGVKGWTVFLDLDESGTLNADANGVMEPSVVTNVDGNYTIKGMIPGNYRVGEVVQPGWTPTSPASLDVTAIKDKATKGVNFFNFSGGDIVGTVWNDLNADGIRDVDASGTYTDPGLAGWTMFLDLNNNKALDPSEPSTVTDADGHYSFTNLPAGDYEVTEELPAGWDVSPGPYDVRQTAAVKARQQFTQDFANFSLTNGSITGTVWNDTNANGIRETDPATGAFTEPGLSDWTVFLDTNNNRIADPGEITTITDANGKYIFPSLPAGDYEVTEALPADWNVSPTFDSRQTVAVNPGENTIAGDFANFTILNGSIRGTIWNDVNRNGVRDVSVLTGATSDPGLANWSVFLDLNRNRVADAGEPSTLTDVNGNYAFLDLQVGDYNVQEVLPAGWEVAPTFSDSQTVTVRSGVESVAPDFANFNLSASTPGSISGVIWNDLNGNGVRDASPAGGFSDVGLSGWTVFVDQNGDKLLSPGEPQAVSGTDGSYTISGVVPGTVSLLVQSAAGWKGTAPITNARTLALKSGENAVGYDFGETELKDSSISGTVYSDTNKDGTRSLGERGLAGITVYLDLNNNSQLDPTEPQMLTSEDLFYTPDVDEAGTYSFTHLAKGTYTVREIIPAVLSATPATEAVHTIVITSAENRTGVDTAAVFRPNEIHGVKFDDANGNHTRDAGEAGVGGTTIFVDLNRNNLLDAGEPTTTTGADGSYTFANLSAGAYVIREVVSAGYSQTSPTTLGGILWPTGVSNPAVGNVGPTSITKSLAVGESYRQTVSLTLPNTGALTNLVDVFLLFDDTGSFTNNSPIVRSAFPDIINQLQTSLPGIDLGFGVGRLEEYGNFAYEYSTGRPFILNQPIVAASSTGYMTAIQAALNRTTPGYGGDQPETDIEALYQLVTGKGFDGNNNGSVLDSGAAGLASTQLTPGNSGDVPSFASFTADPANSVMPAAGNIGGAGFRSGALPIVLLATDTGFAYQPKGETAITGVGGTTLPISSFTQTSRPTTPFNNGAGIQETITGLNALGALVIGLGTNPQATIDPRQGLEAISKLTGATNQSTATIANGTADPIAPGDPLYFQIASGFGASVANGVVSAIQNAVTNVAVDMEVRASDPRVHIINHTGILHSVRAGSTAGFDIEIVGDGVPHRFDLQFVRAGTNVVLGSIPVVLGTPVPGDGYEFEDLQDGVIGTGVDFSDRLTGTTVVTPNVAPSFVAGGNASVLEDAGPQTLAAWATSISAGESGQTVDFLVSNDNSLLFSSQPAISSDGTLTFTPAANAFGTATVTVRAHDNGGTANGGIDTSVSQTFTITIESVNDAPVAVDDSYTTAENSPLTITPRGVLVNDTDIDSDSLTSLLVSSPSHGTLTLGADGSFTYTPDVNFSGTDSFTYKANDGLANSNVATVTLNISPVNQAPVANSDAYTTSEDVSLALPALGVLANDTDAESNPLTALLVTGPSHGTLTLGVDGSFTYTPDANFNGTDSFTYKANDGALDSNVATVSLTIVAVNDPPVATADSYVTSEDVSLTIPTNGVLANDSDIEGDSLTAILVSGPAHGTVVLNSDGSFTYTPAANYNGTDSFSYKANDGAADSSIATVTLGITAVNDAPIASSDSYTTAEDTTLSVAASGLLSNDIDVDGDLLSAILVSGAAHGSLTLNANGSFSYTPATNYNGSDSFTYKANDGLLDSEVVVVNLTITAVNDPPSATADAYTTAEDTTLNIAASGVLANDTDVDGDPLTAILVSGPSHGTLSLNANGSFTYTPALNYNGPDSFSYKASDGTANSGVAVVNLTVTPVNDAPVGNNDAYQTKQDIALSVPAAGVLANDSDVDGDPLSAILATGPANGVLTLNSNGSFAYTPNAGFVGTDSFTYRASDSLLSSNLVTVSITVNAVTTTGTTKFLVVDGSSRGTFNYDANGNLVVNYKLDQENEGPRGIATNKDGSRYWVVDSKGEVFVYNSNGKLLGNWEAKGLDKAEGITTNGQDLWIVDRETDRIYFFAGAASRLTGEIGATSSFALNSANREAMDITTDGNRLWVVNDTPTTDKVFRYSLRGALEGSWQIDANNSKPTGLTIDPNDVNHIWIVDAGTDRVYQYSGATSRIAGQQSAALSFALSSADSNPQGIADPKPVAGTSKVESSKGNVIDAAHSSNHQDSPTAKKAVPSNKTSPTSSSRSVSSSHKSTSDAWDSALASVASEFEHTKTSKVSDDTLNHLAKGRGARKNK